MHFDSKLLASEDYDETRIHPLYPYRTIELAAVIVYGPDFHRNVDFFAIPVSVRIVIGLLLMFVSLAAFVLWMIRRKLERPRNSLISAFFECIVPFIGGGAVNIQHKLERWFFFVLYVSAFLIMTVFAGDILDSVVRIQIQKISTFKQLAELNAPIYTFPQLSMHSDIIHGMLERKVSADVNYQGVPVDGVVEDTRVFIVNSIDIDVVVSLIESGTETFDILEEILGNYFDKTKFMFSCSNILRMFLR